MEYLASTHATPRRALWLVIVMAIGLSLAATEVVLGAIRELSGEVSDRLYLLVFAVASVSSLVLSFFATEFVRNRRYRPRRHE